MPCQCVQKIIAVLSTDSMRSFIDIPSFLSLFYICIERLHILPVVT